VKRILLDECIPKKLATHLVGHDCVTVPEIGWAGRKNGELLSLAEQSGFEVFVTIDRGFVSVKKLSDRDICVILMQGKSSRLADLIPHVPKLLSILESVNPGELVHVP
jgi:hypothetical protein